MEPAQQRAVVEGSKHSFETMRILPINEERVLNIPMGFADKTIETHKVISSAEAIKVLNDQRITTSQDARSSRSSSYDTLIDEEIEQL